MLMLANRPMVNQTTQKKVAFYLRVSTEEQAEEGYSIGAQEDNLRKYASLNDLQVVGVYADKGISGKSMENRLELQRLISDSGKGVFDEVLVWKTSRLARNIYDLLKVVNEFEQNNVTFKSITEPYDTSTPTGKLMMQMLASIGEFERSTIVENLKMGMSARARDGLRNGGKMLGYRSEGTGKDSKLVIVPEEAEIIRKIYDLYLDGNGYRSIANRLNKEGYMTVKGNVFSITSIRDILQNATYTGKITFNKFTDYRTKKRRKGRNEHFIMVDGQHDAIIPFETWSKAQEIMKMKEKEYSHSDSVSGQYPLSGIMVCPVCGHGMVSGATSRKLKDGTVNRTRFYYCGQFRTKGSAACKANSIKADDAENYVFDKIKDILLNENVLRDIVSKLNITREESIQPLENEFTHIDRYLKSYAQRKDRIFELYEDGTINKADLNSRLLSIEDSITKLVTRQAEIRFEIEKNGSDKIPFEVVKKSMANFQKLLDTAEVEQRKTFLQLIVKKITFDSGSKKKVNTIEIHFNETIQHILKEFIGEESSSDDEDSSYIFTITI